MAMRRLHSPGRRLRVIRAACAGVVSIQLWALFAPACALAWTATAPAVWGADPAPSAAHRGHGGVRTAPSVSVAVSVDTQSGNYTVAVNGTWTLLSAPTRLHVNQRWYSSHPSAADEEPLVLSGHTARQAGDVFGSFQAVSLEWLAGNTTFVTRFKVYTARPAVIFEQFFPEGAWGMQQGKLLSDLDQLSSSFPSFRVAGTPLESLAFFTFRFFWDLVMGGVGLGKLGAGGLYGGSPLMLYDHTAVAPAPMLSAVMSPLKNFKVGFQSMPARLQGAIGCGVHGRLKWVPRRFTHQTLLSVGTGVNRGMEAWGDLLLLRYGKRRYTTSAVAAGALHQLRGGGMAFDDAETSPARTHLGYITDTGAYYWYNTEPGKNYQQTMLDVRAYHKSAGIPVGWYELDSWWYIKDTSSGEVGGIRLYEAKPDVFPAGMAWVAQQLDTPLAAHSKYYSANNLYQANFSFMVEPNASIPLTVDFWDFIMSQGASWGLTVWKQDWLASIYELMVGPSEDVYTARNFHLHMAAAAGAAGLVMEYCMPVVSDILESVENPSARYIRLSDDYSTNPLQWHIGRVAIVSWALGLAPFKDTFWSTTVQPGNKINFTEPNPELNAAVASLSTAQVGIGDAIGKTNLTVVMRTCMLDGRLLRTDRPATAIDSTFRASGGVTGEVWHTTAQVATGGASLPLSVATHYVLAANLTKPYIFESYDLGDDVHLGAQFAVVDVRRGTAAASAFVFGSNLPLHIPACPVDKATGVVPWYLFVVAPLLPNGAALLGEPSKYVSVSSQRFHSLRLTTTGQDDSGASSGMCVEVLGVKGERVAVQWAVPAASSAGHAATPAKATNADTVGAATMQVVTGTCAFDMSGTMTMCCEAPAASQHQDGTASGSNLNTWHCSCISG